MKIARQLSFLPDPEPQPTVSKQPARRPAEHLATGGVAIDPEQVVTSLDDAIEKLGREIGRLGTLLDQITDYSLLGNFSQLYAQHLIRYADLLLKQKTLQQEPEDVLLDLLNPALDRLNQSIKLDL
jgi:hypothetical protein